MSGSASLVARVQPDSDWLKALADQDEVGSLLLRGRLATVSHTRVFANTSNPISAVAVSGGLYPTNALVETAEDFVHLLAPLQWQVGSITGPKPAVDALWKVLKAKWDAPRLIRPVQPFLEIRDTGKVSPAGLVKPATLKDLAGYTAAGADLYRQEVGAAAPLRSLRRRFEGYVRESQAFAWIERGVVKFKCDVGFQVGDTCHLQGIWLAPELRGQGLAAGLLADVLGSVLTSEVTRATLYVNDFNFPARSTYRRVGFSEVAQFSTIFF